jgi:mannose-1-phosphate guanylyltransferase
MRAMLLCAGFGTRLGSLSDERPKPMLPVCDIPILRYGIAQLVAHGIRDIVINLHHRGDVITDDIGDGAALGARVVYSREEVILGTGGGLKRALPLLDPDGTDEPFVSMNGKLIFDVDLTALRTAYAAQRDALGMLVVKRVPDAAAWGALDVRSEDAGLRVANFFADGGHMFCGVHVTRPSVVARLPDGEACMVRQGYLPWIQAGARVAAFEHGDGYFAEHSTPERCVASNRASARPAERRRPERPDRRRRGGARPGAHRRRRDRRGRRGGRPRVGDRQRRGRRGRRRRRAQRGLGRRPRARRRPRRDRHRRRRGVGDRVTGVSCSRGRSRRSAAR